MTYVGAWILNQGTPGWLVSLDPPLWREARTGIVRPADDFHLIPTDPNTPRQVHKGARGFVGSADAIVTYVGPDGTIEYTTYPGGPTHTALYRSFSPRYASNH